MSEHKKLVESVCRAIDILELLAFSDRSSSLAEISHRLGLSKSTVHRLLGTLMHRGYVRQEEHSRHYVVGLRLFEITNYVADNLDLHQANAYLTDLMKRTGETVHLAVLDQGEVVYVDKVESEHTIRMHSSLGSRVPAYATSLGKVLFAYSDPELVDRLITQTEFKPLTKNTITDPEALKRQLRTIRRLGYAIDDEENEENIRCIGGPIFDFRGRIIAAFSVSGPTFRMTKERLEELKPIVLEFSRTISAAFGYRIPSR